MKNNNSKHTPGPWVKILREIDYDIQGRNGQPIIETGYKPKEKDAQLIAAAPDMLEALEALINSKDIVNDYAARNKARAAIAKATGK